MHLDISVKSGFFLRPGKVHNHKCLICFSCGLLFMILPTIILHAEPFRSMLCLFLYVVSASHTKTVLCVRSNQCLIQTQHNSRFVVVDRLCNHSYNFTSFIVSCCQHFKPTLTTTHRSRTLLLYLIEYIIICVGLSYLA